MPKGRKQRQRRRKRNKKQQERQKNCSGRGRKLPDLASVGAEETTVESAELTVAAEGETER